jgi:YD repeat-containing protein
MVCAQEVAIDLPQKVLVYEDAEGKTWLAYNNPSYLKERHDIKGCDEVLNKVSGVLGTLVKAAAQ